MAPDAPRRRGCELPGSSRRIPRDECTMGIRPRGHRHPGPCLPGRSRRARARGMGARVGEARPGGRHHLLSRRGALHRADPTSRRARVPRGRPAVEGARIMVPRGSNPRSGGIGPMSGSSRPISRRVDDGPVGASRPFGALGGFEPTTCDRSCGRTVRCRRTTDGTAPPGGAVPLGSVLEPGGVDDRAVEVSPAHPAPGGRVAEAADAATKRRHPVPATIRRGRRELPRPADPSSV